jgi:hypothetical protein
LDSGLLRTWSQIISDDIGSAHPSWLSAYFFPRSGSSSELVADRIEDLLASGSRPSRGVWVSAYYSSAMTSRAEGAGSALGKSPTSYGWVALRRRVERHGPLEGTARHVFHAFAPPIIAQPLRAALRNSESI